VALPALAQPARIVRIGATFDNSGVERSNGAASFLGATAFFEALNKSGGMYGAKVELVMRDDQFKPDLAKSNALALAADKSVIALLSPLGTRQAVAVMEATKDLAVVGPITGTTSLRSSSPAHVFWVRAAYDKEVDKLIHTAVTLGMTRLGIVHPDDPLGKSVLSAFLAAMGREKLEPAVVATTPGTTSTQVEAAAAAVARAQPQMVVMALAGVVPRLVKAIRDEGALSTTLYGLSIGVSADNVAALGELGRGIGFTIVVPSPRQTKYEIVRRYRADMQAKGLHEFSLPSLEGYVNARVLAEGLWRAGPAATRMGLISALEQIDQLDIGGMMVTYGKGGRAGTSFVDLAVIGRDGRIFT
jgi:ABC-type branched-subunit amino acid transport system substrate-binding protein